MKKTPVPKARVALLKALETMPDEAFGWVVAAVATRIYPDGLGGFSPASRTSIEAARKAARSIMGMDA